ncbi:hypothetical protein M9H77_36318 [Catharanthus roseus]|uniref:Uncharacterized protein n=1 Tax=Catharanthus roseus TaxID=4058 RepID=A0ACB9ZRV1_CATRO|nr:hypothetical protein M9H77_36318 [Catharanthus roseus]
MYGARRHTRRGGRWHNRTEYRGVMARHPTSTPMGLGLHTIGITCPTASVKGTVDRYTIRPVLGEAKYQELKANSECLYIVTGSPILTDDHYRRVLGRQQQIHVFGSFGIFRSKPQGLYREGEEVVRIHAAGI